MSWTQLVIALSVLVVGMSGVLIQLAGLPGTWLILLLAVAIKVVETFVPLGPQELLGWWPIIILLGLAAVGEAVEIGAAAAGAKGGGASRRGMLGAVIGSVLLALIATVMIPIPVVGSLIGAAVGAAAGAIVGELSVGGRTLRSTAKPAAGAVAGRLVGVLAKTVVAAAMLVALGIAVFV